MVILLQINKITFDKKKENLEKKPRNLEKSEPG